MIVSSARLAGDAVVDPRDEDVGQLERIMIDVASGRIAYAVLACGGVLGIGVRHYAVPWHELTLDARRRCFVLRRDLADLEPAAVLDVPGSDTV
jgi:sporulation protein YlmC with PRC-barrel domain